MSKFQAAFVVKPVRLMTKGDAAEHCCRSSRVFASECPVPPLIMSNGDVLYDIRDLDDWIDGLKGGLSHDDGEAALARLS